MSLPNYTPDGIIYLGCVPWDNSYSDVRLYETIGEQQGDILPRLDMTSEDYVYIGRDRRLKLSIPADRLYHANYCAYRNRSISQGWIYCFVTDVSYINDNTSEITIETDVFQTYLYATDWDVPACMVERETVREEEKYLLTAEDDFPLAYVYDGVESLWFRIGSGMGKVGERTVVQTSAVVKENTDIAQAFLNPEGYYTEQAVTELVKGVPQGASFSVIYSMDELTNYLSKLAKAGANDSVQSVFVPPSFIETEFIGEVSTQQDSPIETTATITAPTWQDTIDGYTPRNKKLYYFPFTKLRITDFNGSRSELRYEFFSGSSQVIGVKSCINASCQAFAYPMNYSGYQDFESGITVKAGATGSWSCSALENYLGQNMGAIAVDIGLTALSFVPGAGSIALGAKAAKVASTLGRGKQIADAAAQAEKYKTVSEKLISSGAGAIGAATGSIASKAGSAVVGAVKAAHSPQIAKGEMSPEVMWSLGLQGVHACRLVQKAEIAENIDKYFSQFGYSVESTKKPELFTRKSWNYVKTIGAVAKSKTGTPSANAVHTRGAGTPASALALIASMFDAGITFWHTTDGFGDYSLDNSIVG